MFKFLFYIPEVSCNNLLNRRRFPALLNIFYGKCIFTSLTWFKIYTIRQPAESGMEINLSRKFQSLFSLFFKAITESYMSDYKNKICMQIWAILVMQTISVLWYRTLRICEFNLCSYDWNISNQEIFRVNNQEDMHFFSFVSSN